MKLKATIEVEFEAIEGQPENVLTAALLRGRGGLVQGIKTGVGIGKTGIDPESVKVEITKREVTE
jgi:hypothetical protein